MRLPETGITQDDEALNREMAELNQSDSGADHVCISDYASCAFRSKGASRASVVEIAQHPEEHRHDTGHREGEDGHGDDHFREGERGSNTIEVFHPSSAQEVLRADFIPHSSGTGLPPAVET